MANNTTNYSRAKLEAKKIQQMNDDNQYIAESNWAAVSVACRFDYEEELQNLKTCAIDVRTFLAKLINLCEEIEYITDRIKYPGSENIYDNYFDDDTDYCDNNMPF
jgi:hypothetical protein